MLMKDIAILLISFIATLVRSTFGFGESLIAVPLFAIFIPLNVAVPLSVLMSVLVALFVVIQDHEDIHFSSAKWLILYAFIGVPLGLIMLKYGDEHYAKIVLGLVIIGYSVYALTAKNALHLKQDNRFWLFICGFLSGILGGAYGLNGPPLVLYGNMRRWSAKHFRATLQAYFLPVSLIGITGYVIQGLLGWTVIRDFLICLPAAIPAIFLGRFLNGRLRDNAFFKYVYIGLGVIGTLLICLTLFGL